MGILQQIRMTQILDLKWSQDLPSSGESLGYLLSLDPETQTNAHKALRLSGDIDANLGFSPQASRLC